MLQTFVMLFVRHGLTAAGGALAAHGVLGASEVETFVGAAGALVGVAMSAWDKWQRSRG